VMDALEAVKVRDRAVGMEVSPGLSWRRQLRRAVLSRRLVPMVDQL
jgi:hypothetical protein